ncbi:hypothetical protein CTAYLR_003528 [Chrysophaeum taylorii]|uniref:Methyltransferase domain-containing protein n=1 Tax=Chrysophaeum taylorii TaxID=2483200 RepID=A0AAD7UBZ6_9STRA|nr:hypothetical protein CTAYLR_003528 [Chrysophaeum taylorii]
MFVHVLYEGLLVPCLPSEIEAKLEAGGRIADIGCGMGVSSCLLAETFPKAEVHGIDYCTRSIEQAKTLAVTKQLTNVTFSVESADSLAAKHTYNNLDQDGMLLLVEPLAAENDDPLEQAALPTAHIFAPTSALCLPLFVAKK